MNNQKGFILLAVMLMTAMTSVIVISSMRDNVIQERLTGNYQKKMNARLVSEKGIFDTHKRVVDEFTENPEKTLEQLISDTLEGKDHMSGSAETGDMSYISNLSVNEDGLLELSSDGSRFDGRNNMVALFEIIREGGGGGTGSTFQSAITGCNGVTLGGSGSIGTFNSGPDDPNNDPIGNIVNTINQNADITLSGASPIAGSIAATGNIKLTGSAKVTGNAHSNGNINLTGTGTIGGNAQARGSITVKGKINGFAHANGNITIDGAGTNTIGGDVLAQGKVKVTKERVGGVIRTNNNLEFGYSGRVQNKNNDGLDVMYKGSISYPDWRKEDLKQGGDYYKNSRFNVNPNVSSVPEVELEDLDIDYDNQNIANSCDPIGISSFTDSFKASAPSSSDLTLSNGRKLTLTPNGSEIESWKNGDPPNLTSVPVVLPNGKTVNMFKVKNFNVNGGTFRVSGGDVYLMVEGNFTLTSNGDNKFEILSDPEFHPKPTSSLTVFVTGKTSIKNKITALKGLTKDTKLPIFSIYSSYSGNNGVVVDAVGDLYAAIYAPKTNATITASGKFFGAVRAKKLTVSGAGTINYDTQLGTIGNVSTGDGDASGGTPRIRFVGWRYKTDDDDDG